MKKFVRGRWGRLISYLVTALFIVPSLMAPVSAFGQQAGNGRRTVLVIPFQVTATAAPSDVSERIVQELKIALARTQGVQVDTLARNSTLLLRTGKQEDNTEQLQGFYDIIKDQNADLATRNNAATQLAKALGVGAILFGTVDDYQFLTSPNPRQSLLHLTGSAVAIDAMGGVSITPLSAPGRSLPRPDSRGSQQDHDNQAIGNLANNLVILINGGHLPAEKPVIQRTTTATSAQAPKVKKNHKWIWLAVAGAAAIALIATSHHSSKSSTASSSTGGNTDINKTEMGQVFSTPAGAQLQLPVDNGKTVRSIMIYQQLTARADARSAGRTSPQGSLMLTLTPGTSIFNQLVSVQTTANGTTYLINITLNDQSLYVFNAVANYTDGSSALVQFTNGAVGNPATPMYGVTRDMPPPVASLNVRQGSGSQFTVLWTVNDPHSLVTKFQVQLQSNNGAWTNAGTAVSGQTYQQTITVPALGNYTCRVITSGANGSFDWGNSVLTAPLSLTGVTTLPDPSAVAAVCALNNGGYSVQLTWADANDPAITGYQIYRQPVTDPTVVGAQVVRNQGRGTGVGPKVQHGRVNPGTPASGAVVLPSTRGGSWGQPIALVAPGQQQYIDTSISDGQAFNYAVCSYSNKYAQPGISGNIVTPPTIVRIIKAPNNITTYQKVKGLATGVSQAQPGDGKVTITWAPPTQNVDGSAVSLINGGDNRFHVYRTTAQPANSAGYTLQEIKSKAIELANSPVSWQSNGPAYYSLVDSTVSARTTYSYIVIPEKALLFSGQATAIVVPSQPLYPAMSITPIPAVSTIALTDTNASSAHDLYAGDSAHTLSILATGSDAQPQPSVNVQVQCAPATGQGSDGGTLYKSLSDTPTNILTVQTDTNGKASVYYTPPASVPSNINGGQSLAVNITATQQPANSDGSLQSGAWNYTVHRPTTNLLTISSSKPQIAVYDATSGVPVTASNTAVIKITATGNGVNIANRPVTVTCSDTGCSWLDTTNNNYVTFGSTPFTGNTDNNGVLNLTVCASDNLSGSALFTAQCGDPAPPVQVNLSLVAGPPDADHFIVHIPTPIQGSVSGSVRVADVLNNPIAGLPVTLSTNNNASFSPANSVITGLDGQAQFVFNPGTTPGKITLTAQVMLSGGSTLSKTVEIVFAPNLPSSNPQLVSGSLLVTRGSSNPYTFCLYDTIGAKYANKAITISATGGTLGVNAQSISTATLSDGTVSFTYNAPSIFASGSLTFYSSQGVQIGKAVIIQTVLATPTNLLVTGTSTNEVDLGWVASTDAVSYELQRTNLLTNAVAIIPVTPAGATTYADTNGLTPDTPYSYAVRAVPSNPIFDSDWSTPPALARTILASPTGLNATTVSSSAISLSWNAVVGAVSYNILRLSGGNWITDGSVQGTSYTSQNLQGATAYSYAVTAQNSYSTSLPSSVISCTTDPVTPINLRQVNVTRNSIQFAWNSVSGASGYSIQYSLDGTNWSHLADLAGNNATSYTHNALTPNTPYYYQVCATLKLTSGQVLVSDWSATAEYATSPDVPSGLTAEALSDTQVKLSWNTVANTIGYTLRCSMDNATWSTVGAGTITGTTFTDTNLSGGTTYYYEVAAVNISGNSAWSTPSVSVETAPSAPTNLQVTLNGAGTGLYVTWNGVQSATSYQLKYQGNGGTWTTVSNLPANNYTLTPFQPNTTYVFAVCAINGSGNPILTSAWSSSVTYLTAPSSPTNFTATVKSGTAEIDLSWSNNNMIGVSYILSRTTVGGSGSPTIFNVTGTSYNDTSVAYGTTYQYTLCSTNAIATTGLGGNSPSVPPTPLQRQTAPPAPTNFNAKSNDPHTVLLTWTQMSVAATGYDIQRKAPTDITWPNDLGQGSLLTQYTDTTVSPYSTYVYEICSTGSDDNGNTVASPYVTQIVSTDQSLPVATYKLTTDTAKIYFSTDPNDQLSSSAQTIAHLTLNGLAASGGPSVGGKVTLTTSKGFFVASTPDEQVSNGGKAITGILDASGNMMFMFEGRQPSGVAGPLVLPQSNELGTPALTATNDGNTQQVNNGIPTLIGPPSHIGTLSINIPTSFPTVPTQVPTPTGSVSTLFSPNTMTISATVYDANNNPVLPGMPIWFGQAWDPWPDVTNPATASHNQAKGAGIVTQPVYQTDNNGMVTNGFMSNHSGLYTIELFAVKATSNSIKDSLANVGNLNTTSSNYQQYLLPCDSNGSSITAQTQVLNETLAYDTNWKILSITDAPAPDQPVRINSDGTQTAGIQFTAADQDNKQVLPFVPFRVTSIGSNDWAAFTGTLGVLQQKDGTSITADQFLMFDNNSQGYVAVRGDIKNPTVGDVALVFDSLQTAQECCISPTVVKLCGPALSNNFKCDITYNPPGYDPGGNLNKYYPPQISGEYDNSLAPKSVQVTVTMYDSTGNPYPAGYIVTVPYQAPFKTTSNTFTFSYSYNLGADDYYLFDMSNPVTGVKIEDENANNGETIVPNFNKNIQGQIPSQIEVGRPHLINVSPASFIANPFFVNFGDTFSITGNVFTKTGITETMWGGYPILFDAFDMGGLGASATFNPPSVLTPSKISAFPGLVGSIMTVGKTYGMLRVRVWYDENSDNVYDGVDKEALSYVVVGLQQPVAIATAQAVGSGKILVTWSNQPYAQNYVVYEGGIAIATIPWSPTAGNTGYLDTGLTAGANRSYYVVATRTSSLDGSSLISSLASATVTAIAP